MLRGIDESHGCKYNVNSSKESNKSKCTIAHCEIKAAAGLVGITACKSQHASDVCRPPTHHHQLPTGNKNHLMQKLCGEKPNPRTRQL